MQRLVNLHQYLKVDPLLHWRPVGARRLNLLGGRMRNVRVIFDRVAVSLELFVSSKT